MYNFESESKFCKGCWNKEGAETTQKSSPRGEEGPRVGRGVIFSMFQKFSFLSKLQPFILWFKVMICSKLQPVPYLWKRRIMIKSIFSNVRIVIVIFSWSTIRTYNSCLFREIWDLKFNLFFLISILVLQGWEGRGGFHIFGKFPKNFWSTNGCSLLFLFTSDTPYFWL